MNAGELRAQLIKWGVPFKEYAGWSTRGRPASAGPHNDARGIVKHHTGSDAGQSDDYNNFLFVRGRPAEGIPAPLANVSTDMDGDLILGAIGRANHAGTGSRKALELVSAGKAPLTGEISPGSDQSVDGNAYYYGDEVKYDGGQPMTAAQRKTSMLFDASVCDWHNWNSGHVIGHREHTNRKGDPGHNPMDVWRRDLAALLAHGPGIETPGKDVTITISCIIRLTQDKLGVSGACLGDCYQVMNIAVFFYPAMADSTRPAFWDAVNSGNWERAADLLSYAVKIIQSKAGLRQDGVFGPSTGLFLSKRGYTIH
jgi:hypothetical protein